MQIGHFYFIKDQYFKDYPNPNFMSDHAEMERQPHHRPCLCAFTENSHIFWLVPISSKVAKFERICNHKIAKCGKCDTIDFCEILGHRKAVLIQNMFPVTADYILNEYQADSVPVQINRKDQKRIIRKAKHVLHLQRNGVNLIFGGVLELESRMLTSCR